MGSRLLLIDDEEDILAALGEYFSLLDYKVDTAATGEAARSLMAAHAYDIIISDLRLDGVRDHTGLELLREARASQTEVKTILLTAYGRPVLALDAMRIGVDAVVHKPVDLSKLAGMVANLLSQTSAPLGHPC